MKRTLFILAVLVAFATSASAATLSIVSNKTTYNVGETITLSVSGTQAPSGSAQSAFGRVTFNGAYVNLTNLAAAANCVPGELFCTSSQKALDGTWTKGALTNLDNGGAGSFVESLDQVNFAGGNQSAANPISTIFLIADALGIGQTVAIDWDTTSPGNQLNYFGLGSAPGTTFTIVPEPTTAALLGLGLIGLVLGGRRRS